MEKPGVKSPEAPARVEEASCREQESLYRLATEASLAGVYIIQDQRFIYVNARLAQIFGYPAAELLSGRVGPEDLVHPDDRGLVRENLRRLLEGEVASLHYSFRGRRRDGGEIHCEVRGDRAQYQGKAAVVGTLIDITARKVAEEALQSQRSLLNTVFSVTPDLLVQKDRDSVYRWVNQAFCRYLGKDATDILGKTDFDLFPRAEAEIYRQDDARVMESGVALVQDEEVTGASGKKWLQVAKTPVYDEQGRGAGILCSVRDISLRKEMEEDLKASETNYRTIFNAVNDGIAVVDLETGNFVDVNQQWCQMTGFSPEEARGLNVAALCLDEPPFTVADALGLIREASRGNPQLFEFKAITKEGRRHWVEVNLRRAIIGGQERLLAVIRDISTRKRVEEGMRASEAKYRNLVEQIPAITYISALDDVSCPIYISPQIEAILGFTPEELLAEREMFMKQIHPDDRDRVLTDLLLSYAREGRFTAEYRMISKTGRVVWLRDESRSVHDSEGRPLFMQGVALDVTERKKAEEALQEANKKLMALVQASPLAIVGLDLNNKVISWNPAAERIFGWRQREILGLALPIVPKEKRREFSQFWQRMLRGEEFLGLELQPRKKDGSLIDVSLSTAFLRDAAGKLTGAMGVFEDITARKRIEAALRESEARFRAVFEGAPIGMALMDLQRQVQEANPALVEMGGYSEAELRRINFMALTHPDDREADNARFDELGRGEINRYQLEARFRHKQGHWVWVRLSLSLMPDAAGQPRFAIAMVEDITARKQAQEAADEVRRQQEAILNNIPDIAWLKDRESRLIVVNEQYGLACGMAPRGVVGKTDLDIWPPDLATKYRADDLEVMRTGRRKRLEEILRDKEGEESWVDTIKTPIFNERREVIGTAGIARDITKRRRMEEALRKVSRALKAVTECHQAMLRATNEAELLSEICRIIVEVGGYRMAWVGFARQDDEKNVQVMAQEGFEEGYLKNFKIIWANKRLGRGPVGTAIRTGKPAITRNTQTDPQFAPWRQEAMRRGYASVLALPLGNPQPFGSLAIYATEVNAFDDEEINLLIGLANDLAFGIKALRTSAERQRAEEALRDSEQKLRRLASQLLTIQEKERRRISRELHDELGQALTVLKIHMVTIEKKLSPDQQELKLGCEDLLTYIDGVIENVRRLSRDLSPSILEDLGLSSSLKHLLQEICRNNNIHGTLAMDAIDNLFSPEAKINIYRIFQESLTNIVRHAQASRIQVEIKRQGDRVSFLLKDNGIGFDLKQARSRGLSKRGLGLTIMNERALMAGGDLDISSRKGQGTDITLTIPIQG